MGKPCPTRLHFTNYLIMSTESTSLQNGPRTELLNVAPDQLRPAPWNYKQPGTSERQAKLRASIERDGSAGVLAVREVPVDEGGPFQTPDGRPIYETMDGNHRLNELLALGWPLHRVENFGPISKADAILIARRRNASWFDDDIVALGELLQNEVVPQGEGYSVSEMATFMPDSELELQSLLDLVEAHQWRDANPVVPEPDAKAGFKKVVLLLPPDVVGVWTRAGERVAERLRGDGLSLHDDKEIAAGQILELLAAEFLAGP